MTIYQVLNVEFNQIFNVQQRTTMNTIQNLHKFWQVVWSNQLSEWVWSERLTQSTKMNLSNTSALCEVNYQTHNMVMWLVNNKSNKQNKWMEKKLNNQDIIDFYRDLEFILLWDTLN